MSRISRNRIQVFIGDDLILAVGFEQEELDLAPYSISCELRSNSGDGALIGTMTIVKNSPNVNGKVYGFTATLPNAITSTLILGTEYGLDFKLAIGIQVQHSDRMLVEVLKPVTL